MLIEDDVDIRETITSLLEEEGVAVVTAANGAEALSYLRATSAPPQLILLDLMMPVMDGAQFRAEQVKDGRLAAIPVVVLSGHAYARTLASTLGVAEVMMKPLSLDGLLSIVDRYCAQT